MREKGGRGKREEEGGKREKRKRRMEVREEGGERREEVEEGGEGEEGRRRREEGEEKEEEGGEGRGGIGGWRQRMGREEMEDGRREERRGENGCKIMESFSPSVPFTPYISTHTLLTNYNKATSHSFHIIITLHHHTMQPHAGIQPITRGHHMDVTTQLAQHSPTNH